MHQPPPEDMVEEVEELMAATKLTEEGQQLLRAIANNKCSEYVDLSSRSFGDDEARAIAVALRRNTRLKALSLSDNSIGPGGAASFAHGLRDNTVLTELRFINNSFGNQGAASMAELLMDNHVITKLSLRNNSIGPEGAKALAEMLRHNTTLRTLFLSDNFIGPGGAEALATILSENDSLTTLHLSGNSIGNDGAAALAGGLRSNTGLHKLDLYLNDIGPKGAVALAAVLAHNQDLEYLSLKRNGVETARAFGSALPPDREISGHWLPDEETAFQHARHNQRRKCGRRRQSTTHEATSISEKIKKTMRDLAERGDEGVTLARGKLVVVGQSGGGKTATLRSCMGQPLQTDEPPTFGGRVFDAILTMDAHNEFHWKCGNDESLGTASEPTSKKDEHQHQHQPQQQRRQSLKAPHNNQGKRANSPLTPDSEEEMTFPTMPQDAGTLNQVTVKVFDLGGQSTFYVFHSLFLTQYAVYLVVFSMVDLLHPDENRRTEAWDFLSHWLCALDVHADGAPILIVGTYADVVTSPVLHQQLSRALHKRFHGKPMFESVVHNDAHDLWFWPIDNTRSMNDAMIQDLRHTICSTMTKQPFVSQTIPAAFVRLYLALQRRMKQGKLCLSVEEAAVIGKAFGLRSEAEASACLQLLHLYSMVIYCASMDELPDHIILSPAWTLNTFTYIIRSFGCTKDTRDEEVLALGPELWDDLVGRGILHRRVLGVLWNHMSDAAVEQFLDVMLKHGLLVDRTSSQAVGGRGGAGDGADAQRRRYLVPAILPMFLEASAAATPCEADLASPTALSTTALRDINAYPGFEANTAYVSFCLEGIDRDAKAEVRVETLQRASFVPEGLFAVLLAHVLKRARPAASMTSLLSRSHVIVFMDVTKVELQLVPAVGGIKIHIEGPEPGSALQMLFTVVEKAVGQRYPRLNPHRLLPFNQDMLLFFDAVYLSHMGKQGVRVQHYTVDSEQMMSAFGSLLPALEHDVTGSAPKATSIQSALNEQRLRPFSSSLKGLYMASVKDRDEFAQARAWQQEKAGLVAQLQTKQKELDEAKAQVDEHRRQVQRDRQRLTSDLEESRQALINLRRACEQQETELRQQLKDMTRLHEAAVSKANQLQQELAMSTDERVAVAEAETLRLKTEMDNFERRIESMLNLDMDPARFADKKRACTSDGDFITGGFSKLYKATIAGHAVALKEVDLRKRPRLRDLIQAMDGSNPDNAAWRVRRELRILVSLRHPNIVSFIGLCYNRIGVELSIVLSWAENGSVYDYMHRGGNSPSDPTKLRILSEVAGAMEYLHAHRVVHRDLKSPNVLLDASLSAKVADFGLSTLRSIDDSVVSKVVGTVHWASPEQLLKGEALRADTDVFSFGCVAWEVWFGVKPWHHRDKWKKEGASFAEICAHYSSGQYLPIDTKINEQEMPPQLRALLRACFTSSGSRLSFAQLHLALHAQLKMAKQRLSSPEYQSTVDMVLFGDTDAAWKFTPEARELVKGQARLLSTRSSVHIAPLDLADPDQVDMTRELLRQAGGSTAAQRNLLQPFGHRIHAVAITWCDQKLMAFNGALHLNKVRFRGHLTSTNHPFSPTYPHDTISGEATDPEDKAVLEYATWPHLYCMLAPALLLDDPPIRIQRVFHGVTCLDAVLGVLGGDISQLHQPTNKPWFGTGFYFTPDLDYALGFTKECKLEHGQHMPPDLRCLQMEPGKSYRIVLACDVQYGNPFPVRRELQQSDASPALLTPGHDARVTVVDFASGDIHQAQILKSHKQWNEAARVPVIDLAIEDPSCVLVRAILVFAS